MSKEKKTLKERWNNICEEYLKAFCEKHGYFLDDAYWIGNDIGGVASIADYYVGIDTMRYDIDNDISENVFLEWYDYVTEIGMWNFKETISFENWCKGAPKPYSMEDIERFKRLTEELKNLGVKNY